jgi:hypothetical protein
MVHNTNITSSSPPNGGADKFNDEKLDNDYLPLWMQALGYNTYFTGKFINQYGSRHVEDRCPLGWNVTPPR